MPKYVYINQEILRNRESLVLYVTCYLGVLEILLIYIHNCALGCTKDMSSQCRKAPECRYRECYVSTVELNWYLCCYTSQVRKNMVIFFLSKEVFEGLFVKESIQQELKWDFGKDIDYQIKMTNNDPKQRL
ncbi:hypothetical protein PHYBLDRAFT_165231 [Phycomyces blakesleeanus NRRL 1555(-)]|uniref:Uncharacterized protein n=2 Tax=Phycomyces blakesleeanus TaxID=4837 RepID=A0A167NVT4_PHYB8|nr:hypothetical protein PHYBLDRAFT_165231 [Phycomyces blakesleeanus NRRL 1555(-)]OAD76714.1 hypothetical protein PHYBLDRAFT_165231 [Phycomyces blakesleeanus NRRL 1555(-)]|eukprot:XP_018294754.1 hypothetical protein PHYBLDRAFT_165231 [Phycomyces blakesleeanus NRRL 1555(-)]